LEEKPHKVQRAISKAPPPITPLSGGWPVRDRLFHERKEADEKHRDRMNRIHRLWEVRFDRELERAEKQLVEQTKLPQATQAESKLERLRHECGLSHKGLADETGILNEKTVRGHCHGKPMRPATGKLYMQVFSRLLNRPVGLADIR
jgi:hypothetical protein